MDDPQRQRIDRWLFFTRVVKSRSLAARLVQSGKVRVNREKVDQAARSVKIGDVLTITLDRQVLVYRVVAPGTRRGPAPEARMLYEDLTPPATRPETASEAASGERERGAGRPTKRDRRRLDAFQAHDPD